MLAVLGGSARKLDSVFINGFLDHVADAYESRCLDRKHLVLDERVPQICKGSVQSRSMLISAILTSSIGSAEWLAGGIRKQADSQN